MATYKVLQDIEAEDKLFGPLTLKQFIFAAIFILIGVVQFFIATSPAPTFLKIPFIAVLLLPMILFGFLAAPISRDQPNEIWLLARISFLFRPRVRIWNQDGISHLVTITAPKKEVHVYTNGLTQTEVKSRLQALANTVDSRGWAVKNVNTNLFAEPGYLSPGVGSDRLLDPMSLPQEVPNTDITAADDMLDISSNSTAAHLNQLVQQSTAQHRQQAISSMKSDPGAQPTPTNYWFMNQSAPAPQMPLPNDFATFQDQQVVAPGTTDAHPAAEETAAEHEFAEKLVADNSKTYERYNEHIKTLQPLHDREGNTVAPATPEAKLNPVDNPYEVLYGNSSTVVDPSVPLVDQSIANEQIAAQPVPVPAPAQDQGQNTVNPAILGLAHRDDLNVSTIANEAKRMSQEDGEVVISLH